MSIRGLLETFEATKLADAQASSDTHDPSVEDVRAAAFEAGYASGWDDARSADDQARKRVQAEFERNVEAISFTYHEAVDRVRGELKNFIDALLTEFLPDILPIALREHIRAELLSISDSQTELSIEIVMAPNCAELVAELMESEFVAGIDLVEDKSLASNQVFVRIAEHEKEINLAPLISELRFQLGAMTDPNFEARKHG